MIYKKNMSYLHDWVQFPAATWNKTLTAWIQLFFFLGTFSDAPLIL